MKNVKKLAAVFLYLAITAFALDFPLLQLFDIKQILLIIIGMIILFLPGFHRGEKKQTYSNQLARCALFAGYIQTFLLLFTLLSGSVTADTRINEIALNCRPLLYGFCIWIILSGEAPKEAKISKPLTATEYYEAYRKLGLTNREAELAVQIGKGLSNAEIAAELNMSETTVKKHISNIFEKLEVTKREQIREKLYEKLDD